MSDTVFIPINRTKMILLTVGYGLAGIIAFCIIYYGGMQFESISHTIFKIIALVVLLFFAVVAGTFAKNIRNQSAGLQIDRKGITDSSSSISFGLIPWKDIVSINKYKSPSAKYMVIKVKKEKKYLEAAKNGAIRKLLDQNLAQFKTPVVINVGILKTNLTELEAIISSHLKQ